jgi:hypothetical protein
MRKSLDSTSPVRDWSALDGIEKKWLTGTRLLHHRNHLG